MTDGAAITDSRRQTIEERFTDVIDAFRSEPIDEPVIVRLVDRLADEAERQIEAALLESLPRRYYTVPEAAQMLACSTRSIYRAMQRGDIPSAQTVIGQKRIPAAEFDTLT